MANFEKAIGFVRKWEGGYVNDPHDRGGETYAGITRKNWPDWEGWKYVDAAKPLKDGDKVPEAEPFVNGFYHEHYWRPIKGDQINDQQTAGFLLDFYVHSGVNAVKAIQRVTGAYVDGLVGPQTIRSINGAKNVFDRLKQARIAFLRHVATLYDNKKYLAGWLRRVRSYR